jgi:hypothetical protein
VQLFSPERIRMMMQFAPVGLRSGWAALWASVAKVPPGLLLSLHFVISGSRLFAPTNPKGLSRFAGLSKVA